jgi:hypothetical protein
MLLSLKLPAGVYRNGTALQSAGRFYDANLVRWFSGELRPMGGWQKHSAGASAMSGIPRSVIAWRGNNGSRWIAAATAAKLYAMNEGGTLSDITPAGFTSGVTNATAATGYGSGPYGSYAYGTPRPDTGARTPATVGTLDTWGEDLLFCSDADGKIYQWALDPATPAAVLSNAPTGNASIVVTPERIVMALGAGGDPRLVQNSDQANNNTWAVTDLNKARSFELQTVGTLMCGRAMQGETLLLTTVDAWSAKYVGYPIVYGYTRVGEGCGAISKRCVIVTDSQAVWMGPTGFYTYSGAVVPLPCDVQDYVYSNINTAQQSKVNAVHLSSFNEVMWLYPSTGSVEVDSYVVWNYVEDHWNIGKLARTCGVDKGVFDAPLMAGTDGYVYEHDTGFAYDGQAPYAETGPFELGNSMAGPTLNGLGDQVMAATQIIGDEKVQGDVNVTVYSSFYPNAEETTFGPYSFATTPTDLRFTARQARFRFTGVRSDDWRIGNVRLDVTAGGRR